MDPESRWRNLYRLFGLYGLTRFSRRRPVVSRGPACPRRRTLSEGPWDMATNLVFSHVALACSDPVATERFYTAHFGFSRARVVPLGDGEQIVFLKAGDVYLELFQAREGRPGPAPTDDGPWWPAFDTSRSRSKTSMPAARRDGTNAVIGQGPMNFDAFIPGWRVGLGEGSGRQHRRDQPGLHR